MTVAICSIQKSYSLHGMACNKATRTGYAKGMLLADHPELFQGWELDPASDSQILLEPETESNDGQSSGLEKSPMTVKVKQEEEDSKGSGRRVV